MQVRSKEERLSGMKNFIANVADHRIKYLLKVQYVRVFVFIGGGGGIMRQRHFESTRSKRVCSDFEAIALLGTLKSAIIRNEITISNNTLK
jgi:hypothetical protein